MRAQKHLVLPDEDAAEFADLERRCSRSWPLWARSRPCSPRGVPRVKGS
jgi:hypothetical protein